MFYGQQAWDPILICAQILALQALWYLSLGSLLWLLLGPYVAHISLQHMFNWRWVSFHRLTGWMIVLANIFNALAASISLMVLVERAKKCLDFASTIYVLHIIACCAYGGFPWQLSWWFVNFIAFAITAVLGEWLCLQREMQDIPVTTGSRGGRRGAASTTVEMTSIKPSGTNESAFSAAVQATSFSFIKTPGSVSASRVLSNTKSSGLNV